MTLSPQRYTVIFPFSGDGKRILLGLKKRGMGVGLWNGFGGKPEIGETIDQCAHRELKEECGLEARDLQHVGVLSMYSSKSGRKEVFVYTAKDIVGGITESDEMRPEWFNVADLTYKDTYKEAQVWWPTMLKGSTFVARFEFVDGDITFQEISPVEAKQLAQLRSSANEP
ncbi:Nudix (Nucleoside diphosphate linked moiety X)-type motif 1 [Coemansia sp. RSA 2050]|nr:Nudix (Nucleoside diphosphate linked moiety X)-type motif 1 [Coemansia sp. RSA 2050]KAJ2732638.1 Nudix (Nucleoside diphosphate linked moiety X)-type motif 1 [Coemansia sp. BCRC 34962]